MKLLVNPDSVSDRSPVPGTNMMITPPVGDESYYLAKVPLGDNGQAIKAFPKFGIVGCGFAQEEDWNTNLPIGCGTDEIWNHIKHNKGDDSISDEDCIEAIELLKHYFVEEAQQ